MRSVFTTTYPLAGAARVLAIEQIPLCRLNGDSITSSSTLIQHGGQRCVSYLSWFTMCISVSGLNDVGEGQNRDSSRPKDKKAQFPLHHGRLRDYSCRSQTRLPAGHHTLYAVPQVEETLYRFHRHFLTRRSKVFADLFELPPEAGQLAEGLTDERPIFLEDVTCRDFERLLSLFYPE